VEVVDWREISPNIWQAPLEADAVTQLFQGNKRLHIARTPDSGYYRFDTVDDQGISDDHLAADENYWADATLLFHLNEFWWEEAVISSSSPEGHISFEYTADNEINPLIPGSGFFIQNKLAFLDAPNEWFFDADAEQIYLYSENDPNADNLRASTATNGFQTVWPWVNEHIVIQGLEFKEQAENGIAIRGSEGLVVKNCYIHDVGQYGVLMSSDYQSMSTKAEISGNEFHDCMANGIYTFNVADSLIVRNNIERSGLYPVTGGATEASGQCGMRLWFGDWLTISYNTVNRSGNCGISMESSHSLIEKNIVDHSMLLLSDGGAIYNNEGGANTYRSNIMRYTEGNMDASAPDQARYTKELYFDIAGESDTIVENNTMIGGPKSVGIGFTPGTSNVLVQDNVAYHVYRGLELSNYDQINRPIEGLTISGNTFYTNMEGGHPYYVNAWNGLSGAYIDCDNNYLCNPFADEICEHENASNKTYLKLAEWRAQSGVDARSTPSFFQWEYPEDHSFILLNTSETEKTYHFAEGVFDLDNNEVRSITLAPFSSKVLIGSTESFSFNFTGWEGYASSGNQSIHVLEGINYEAWRMKHFTGSALPSNLEDDPDGDGRSNYWEYAFGTDPLAAHDSAPKPCIFPASEEAYSILLRRPVNAIDIRYRLESSSNLGEWTSVAENSDYTLHSILPQDDGTELINYHLTKDSDGPRFVRISAESTN